MTNKEAQIFDYILEGMLSLQKASELYKTLEESQYKQAFQMYFTWIGSLTQELGIYVYLKEYIEDNNKKKSIPIESFDDIIKKLMEKNNEDKGKTDK